MLSPAIPATSGPVVSAVPERDAVVHPQGREGGERARPHDTESDLRFDPQRGGSPARVGGGPQGAGVGAPASACRRVCVDQNAVGPPGGHTLTGILQHVEGAYHHQEPGAHLRQWIVVRE